MSDELKKQMKQYNYPEAKAKDNYVGIEIEFSSPIPEREAMDMLVDHSLAKYIQIGYDGGPPDGHVGYEWKVLVKEKEMKQVLDRLGKLFGYMGAMANHTCGLHVHLDMRHRKPELAYNNLVRAQKVLYAVANQKRVLGRWASPSHTVSLADAPKGKYVGINPHLTRIKQTIEVRIREGIVDTDDIYKWAQLLIAIADTKHIKKGIETFPDLETTIKFDEELKEYVELKCKENKRNDMLKKESA